MGGGHRTTRLIGAIAGRSRGVVTRAELLDAGITRREIERRIEAGSLLPQFPGVYRVGHAAPSAEATYVAAVRACGERAVLSGLAAAHVHRLVKGAPPPPEVTAPTERKVRGLRTKRCRGLSAADVTRVAGIPVTTVARTLVDLAGVLRPAALARACHEAMAVKRVPIEEIDAALARRRNARGAAALRRILHGDERVTLSRLESRFLAVLRANGLPLPGTNVPAGGRYVDCRWPAQRLTVELDSYRFHNSRQSWERDRRREREAYARGDEFRRYTWDDVTADRTAMLRELRGLLAARR